MIGLDEAKTIIHGADPDLRSDQYDEIDSDTTLEEGWEHLGDDYFYHEKQKKIAGPGKGSPTRIIVNLATTSGRVTGIEDSYDSALEWDMLEHPSEANRSPVTRQLKSSSSQAGKYPPTCDECTCNG